MNKSVQLTEDGLNEVIAQLEDLKSKRGEIAERIATAREFGDLKENAEYSAAREEQGVVETKIAELEEIVSNAEVVEEVDKTKISLGSKVTIERVSDKKKFTYTIVGSIEADFKEGKISDESPMGAALVGKKEKETVTVKAPAGNIDYKIVSFE